MNSIFLDKNDTVEQIIQKASQVRPTERQVKWQELEFISFIHFGMNTFTNQEWGDGKEDPQLFNPTEFDANQIVTAVKSAKMKGLILTCKHHDGFCLWQSDYTEHCMKSSPYRDGKGDIVKELSEECAKQGIKFGVYLSPWDRHEHSYGYGDEYNAFYINQLTELLTNYGEIFDVWLDGACQEGANGKLQVYDWLGLYKKVRELQPSATISVVGPDVRWCGNEAGICRANEWSVVTEPPIPPEKAETMTKEDMDLIKTVTPKDKTEEDLGSIEKLIEYSKNNELVHWFPSQVNMSIRPGWFYHPYEDDSVYSLDKLVNVYLNSVGGNAQFLLNLTPDTRGLIPDTDVVRLKELGEYIEQTFTNDYAQSVEFSTPTEIIVECKPEKVNMIVLAEDIRQGQQVEQFEIYSYKNNSWELILTGNTIGYKRIVKLSADVYDKLKVVITKSRATPTLKQPKLHNAPRVSKEVEIVRTNGTVAFDLPLGGIVTIQSQGITTTKEFGISSVTFDLPLGGVVTIQSQGITTTKEFGISSEDFKIINSNASLINDLNKVFAQDEMLYPKFNIEKEKPTIHIDMGKEYNMSAFNYDPVKDGFDANYNVFTYNLLGSVDGENYFTIFKDKELSNIYHNPILFKHIFEQPISARYLKFEVVGTLNQNTVVIGKLHFIAT